MKGMKGRLLKKLKSIRQIGAPKNDRVVHINALDGLLDLLPPDPQQAVLSPSVCTVSPPEPEVVDVYELMRDLGENPATLFSSSGDKENVQPDASSRDPASVKETLASQNHKTRHAPLSELDKSSFRRPEMNSGFLFDPNLLAAFQQVVTVQKQIQEPQKSDRHELEDPPEDDEPPGNPLSEFEERCPPGGTYSVILYTTTIRGIRKTFEDCNRVRFLLENLKVLFHERDVSMHLEYREELWRILEGRVVPPRLFIKGRYIGGADSVLGLHERGKLRPLLEDIPLDRFGGMCDDCHGMRFLMCSDCNGSRKIATAEHELYIRCPNCNENGLVICSLCC